MARVLVTGGAGFIGSHIVDAFISAKHTVAVIDNLSSGSIDNLPEGTKLYQCEIESKDGADAVRDFDPEVLVHTAAQISVRRSMDEPVYDAQVNVVGLVNLLTALKEKAGRKVVFLSTGGAIYGEQVSFPAQEDHQVKPESLYGLSKWIGEEYLSFFSRVWGLKASVLRLSNVYGPRQNPHGEAGVVAIFCRGLLNNKPLTINGTGEQTRDFVFVKDVARAANICATGDFEGVFNIGTGVETTLNTLVEALVVASETSGNISKGAAKGGEQMRSCINPTHALQTFGWKAEVALSEGVKATMEWFRTHG